MTKRLLNFLVLVLLFLLPWQTRYIYAPGTLGGAYWEYTTQSLYATELLLWVIILLFFATEICTRAAWEQFRSRWAGQRKIFFGLVVALLITAAVIVCSPDPTIAYYYIFHLLEAVALGVVIIRSALNGQKLYLAFWLGAVGQALLGLGQFFTQNAFANKWLGLAAHTGTIGDFVIETAGGRWLRAYGAFGSPNMFGAYLASGLIIGLFLIRRTSPRWRYLLTLGQGVLVFGLFVSFSRAAWLAALMGIIVLIGLAYREKIESLDRRLISAQVVLYLFLSLGLLLMYLPLVTTRLAVSGRLEERSLYERTSQYGQAKDIFFTHPWLGVGPGEYTPTLFSNLGANAHLGAVQPVHNVYLLVLVELGMPLFALLAIAGLFIVRAIWRRNPLGLALVVPTLTLGLFDHFWWTLFTGVVLWWVIFALAYKEK